MPRGQKLPRPTGGGMVLCKFCGTLSKGFRTCASCHKSLPLHPKLLDDMLSERAWDDSGNREEVVEARFRGGERARRGATFTFGRGAARQFMSGNAPLNKRFGAEGQPRRGSPGREDFGRNYISKPFSESERENLPHQTRDFGSFQNIPVGEERHFHPSEESNPGPSFKRASPVWLDFPEEDGEGDQDRFRFDAMNESSPPFRGFQRIEEGSFSLDRARRARQFSRSPSFGRITRERSISHDRYQRRRSITREQIPLIDREPSQSSLFRRKRARLDSRDRSSHSERNHRERSLSYESVQMRNSPLRDPKSFKRFCYDRPHRPERSPQFSDKYQQGAFESRERSLSCERFQEGGTSSRRRYLSQENFQRERESSRGKSPSLDRFKLGKEGHKEGSHSVERFQREHLSVARERSAYFERFPRDQIVFSTEADPEDKNFLDREEPHLKKIPSEQTQTMHDFGEEWDQHHNADNQLSHRHSRRLSFCKTSPYERGQRSRSSELNEDEAYHDFQPVRMISETYQELEHCSDLSSPPRARSHSLDDFPERRREHRHVNPIQEQFQRSPVIVRRSFDRHHQAEEPNMVPQKGRLRSSPSFHVYGEQDEEMNEGRSAFRRGRDGMSGEEMRMPLWKRLGPPLQEEERRSPLWGQPHQDKGEPRLEDHPREKRSIYWRLQPSIDSNIDHHKSSFERAKINSRSGAEYEHHQDSRYVSAKERRVERQNHTHEDRGRQSAFSRSAEKGPVSRSAGGRTAHGKSADRKPADRTSANSRSGDRKHGKHSAESSSKSQLVNESLLVDPQTNTAASHQAKNPAGNPKRKGSTIFTHASSLEVPKTGSDHHRLAKSERTMHAVDKRNTVMAAANHLSRPNPVEVTISDDTDDDTTVCYVGAVRKKPYSQIDEGGSRGRDLDLRTKSTLSDPDHVSQSRSSVTGESSRAVSGNQIRSGNTNVGRVKSSAHQDSGNQEGRTVSERRSSRMSSEASSSTSKRHLDAGARSKDSRTTEQQGISSVQPDTSAKDKVSHSGGGHSKRKHDDPANDRGNINQSLLSRKEGSRGKSDSRHRRDRSRTRQTSSGSYRSHSEQRKGSRRSNRSSSKRKSGETEPEESQKRKRRHVDVPAATGGEQSRPQARPVQEVRPTAFSLDNSTVRPPVEGCSSSADLSFLQHSPPVRHPRTLQKFFTDCLRAEGRPESDVDDMIKTWVMAGYIEANLKTLALAPPQSGSSGLPSAADLRHRLIRALTALCNSPAAIPVSVQVDRLLDRTVHYFISEYPQHFSSSPDPDQERQQDPQPVTSIVQQEPLATQQRKGSAHYQPYNPWRDKLQKMMPAAQEQPELHEMPPERPPQQHLDFRQSADIIQVEMLQLQARQKQLQQQYHEAQSLLQQQHTPARQQNLLQIQQQQQHLLQQQQNYQRQQDLQQQQIPSWEQPLQQLKKPVYQSDQNLPEPASITYPHIQSMTNHSGVAAPVPPVFNNSGPRLGSKLLPPPVAATSALPQPPPPPSLIRDDRLLGVPFPMKPLFPSAALIRPGPAPTPAPIFGKPLELAANNRTTAAAKTTVRPVSFSLGSTGSAAAPAAATKTTEDDETYAARVESLKPLFDFLLRNMGAVMKKHNFTDAHIDSLARTGRDLLAKAGCDMPALRQIWAFAGKGGTAFRLEQELAKQRNSFPRNLDVKTLALFATDFLAENSR